MPRQRSSSKSAAAKAVRGRPKDPEKGRAIIDAACRLFLAHSYETVSMDAIADAAGVSKMTVYGHFADKEQLFGAAVATQCQRAGPPPMPDLATHSSFRRSLEEFGIGLLRILTNPEIHRFHRMLLPHVGRTPRVAQAFYESGPRRMHLALTELLQRAHELGHIPALDFETV